jgi:peptidoglycan/xylan/chitin deacetylase (PgdA/CDA1 family)
MDTTGIYVRRLVQNLKTAARFTLSVGLYYTGAVSLYRLVSKDGGGAIKILCYHDIGDRPHQYLSIPAEIFEAHVRYLVENGFRVIGIEEAAMCLRNGGPPARDTVAITFDDGYRSIYTDVFPIVKRYGVPVTVYITTEPVETGYPLFIEALIHALDKTELKTLDLRSWGMDVYPLWSRLLREKACTAVSDWSKEMPTEERKRLIEHIFAQLGVDFHSPELRGRMLSWAEIREMAENGVSFGAHTVTHPSLARIRKDESAMEISRSRDVIRERLGRTIESFAYPYGSPKDFNAEVRRIVERAGFSSACTLVSGVNAAGDDPYLMKRYCIVNQIRPRALWPFSRAVFAVQVSGIMSLMKGKR